MSFSEWSGLALLFAVGIVSGGLNVIAAGGSFLTLPVLIFLGLPAAQANATNRVGVLAQNVSGLWGYHRAGMLPWRWAILVSLPALAGGAAGAWAALHVSEFAFRRFLGIAMLAATLWTLRRAPVERSTSALPSPWRSGTVVSFLLIGAYGGFIQAGMGFGVLAATSAAGLDLVRGNAVKVLTAMLVSMLALGIFASSGVVSWGHGLALAAGNGLGAWIGVRLALAGGNRWIQRVVTVAVVAFAVLLLFEA